jgi:tryptophanyl-tRNA synthetase
MRVLSGIQPSGIAHLGNYFGYIQPNVSLVGQGEVLLMVADLHALTTVHAGKDLQQFRTNVALDLIASGFDVKKGILFFQSDIPEHTELMWILSAVTPMGLLERAVSYKDKVQQGLEANVGLFTYPVLQAADILLYQADTVPVGKDQKQHIEMARDIAQKFNSRYEGDYFILPDAKIREDVAVVPGIDGQKMSKSYGNTIPMFDEKAMKKAIMGIVTDSKGMNDPKDPETCVIYQIHKLFLSAAEQKELAAEYKNGLPYGEAKKKLLQTVMDHFAPMRARREALAKNPAQLQEIASHGAVQARHIASATMERVRSAVGLSSPL